MSIFRVVFLMLSMLASLGSALAASICTPAGYSFGAGFLSVYKDITVSYTCNNYSPLYTSRLLVSGQIVGGNSPGGCSGGSAFVANGATIIFQGQRDIGGGNYLGGYGNAGNGYYPAAWVPACTIAWDDGGGGIPEGFMSFSGTRVAPVLSVAKSASANVLVAGATGQSYTITINVTNAPTTSAVTIADVLPAGVTTSGNITIDSANSGLLSGCASVGATSLAGCTIAAGANTPIVITVPVNVAASTANPVSNLATVSGGGDTTCPAGANCTSTYTAPVISAVNDVDSKAPGLPSSTNVSVNDKFPANATFMVTGGTCSAASPFSPVTNTTGVLGYTLPAASPSCTVLYKVCAPSPNSTICASATLTVTPVATTIAVSKVMGSARVSDTDQFTVQVNNATGTSTLTSSTTLGAGSAVTGGSTGAFAVTAGTSYTINEVASGSANLAQYIRTLTCIDSAGIQAGLPSAFVFSANTGYVLTPVAGAQISCTITNSPALARLTIKKTTTVGTGSFIFNGSATNANGFSTNSSYTVTTTAANTVASGTQVTLTVNNAVTEVTETVPSNWVLSSATCTDVKATVTGNTGSFGTLTGATLQIPASNVRPGADLQCTFTNAPAAAPAKLTIKKTTTVGTGSFTFNGSTANANGFSTDNSYVLTTTTAGTPVGGSVVNLTASNTLTEVQETVPAAWVLSSVSCVDSNAATTGNPVSFGTLNGATLQIAAANVRVGSNLACTFTNVPAPTLTVTQLAIVIAPATFNPPKTFGYTGNNGWIFQQNSSTALNTATKGVTQTLSAVNVATTLTLAVPTVETGWRIASIKCTDTKSGASGNPATTLASSTTNTVTVPANYVVANAALQCAVIATRQQL